MKYLVEPLMSDTHSTVTNTSRAFTLASILNGQVVTGGSSVGTSRWAELDTQQFTLTRFTPSSGTPYYRIGRGGAGTFLTVEGSATSGWTVADRTMSVLVGSIEGGNDQRVVRSESSITGGTAVFAPLLVRVRDTFGNPVAGVEVRFMVGTKPSSMSVQIQPSGASTPVTTRTDASGIAKLALMPGGTSSVYAYYGDGTFSIVASVTSGPQFTFTGTVVPTTTSSVVLSHVSGNNQTIVGTPVTSTSWTATFAPLMVQVKNSAGSPMVGATVRWLVVTRPSGSTAKLDPANSPSVQTITDAQGVATLAQLNGSSMTLTGPTGAFAIEVSVDAKGVVYFVGMMAAPAVPTDCGSGGPQAWSMEVAGPAGVRLRSAFAGGYLQLVPGNETQAPRLTVGSDLGGAGRVEAFVDKSYGGGSMPFGLGRLDTPQLRIGNDQISSLRVPPGYKVTLFYDRGFKGDSRGLVADSWYLNNFNDYTSSVIVQPYRLTAYAGKPLTATIHADPDYAGLSQSFDVGVYTLSEMWVGNDAVSSVTVPAGLEVVLCTDNWFWGTQKVFSASTGDLGDLNNKTSSLIVRRVGGPTVTAYSDPWFLGTATVLPVGAWVRGAPGSFSSTPACLKIPPELMVTPYNKDGVLKAPIFGDYIFSAPSGSSLLVEPAMPVVFSSDGRWQKLRPGAHNSTALTIGATNITRLQVPQGYTATLFTEDGFTGGFRTYAATTGVDLPPELSRRIRSITVEPVLNCASQIWRFGLVRGLEETRQSRATLITQGDGVRLEVAVGTWDGFYYDMDSAELNPFYADLEEARVETIEIPEGYRLTLFSEARLSGNFKAYTSNTTLSSPFLARSVFLEPVVYLYENTDLSGERVELGVGRFDLNAGDIAFSNRASAIRVPAGLVATLYDNSNYTGLSRSYVEDTVLDSAIAKKASAIQVRPLAFPIPRGSVRYGNQINLKSGDRYLRYFPDSQTIKVSTEAPPEDAELGNYGDFRIVRAGVTTFPHLVSFGDIFALQTRAGQYVTVQSDGRLAVGGTNTSDAWPFRLVRAGTTMHNQVVTHKDQVALMSAEGRYLTADGSTAPAMARDSIGTWEKFVLLDASAAPVTAAEGLHPASCSFNVCSTAACGTDMQLIGANDEASFLSLFCAGDAAGSLAFGDVNPARASGEGTSCGAAACGADVCGAAACGAAACGAAACFQEATGITACGADACYGAACGVAATGAGVNIFVACGVAASGVSVGGITICGVDACGVDLCAIDACGADACGVDLIPGVPLI